MFDITQCELYHLKQCYTHFSDLNKAWVNGPCFNFQIKAKPETLEEILLVSDVQCKSIPTESRKEHGETSEDKYTNQENESESREDRNTSTNNTNDSQPQKFSTHVKWTHPGTGKDVFQISVQHLNQDDKITRSLIGQTRSCHYVVSHSLLDRMEPPVHLEIMPVAYNPWQTMAGPYRILIKDVKLSETE